MGEVIGDLNMRQGKIEQITTKGPVQILTASVPLSKMFGYSTSLRSITQGRGTFTLEFSHFEEAPNVITQKIVAERQAEKGG